MRAVKLNIINRRLRIRAARQSPKDFALMIRPYPVMAHLRASLSRYSRLVHGRSMSASLIGRVGSSVSGPLPLVWMSLAGSCFSPESALRPFHHGIRGRGGAIFGSVLTADCRQIQADMRSHLIRRPARDTIPPRGGARVSSYWVWYIASFMRLRSAWSIGTRCRRARCDA